MYLSLYFVVFLYDCIRLEMSNMKDDKPLHVQNNEQIKKQDNSKRKFLQIWKLCILKKKPCISSDFMNKLNIAI